MSRLIPVCTGCGIFHDARRACPDLAVLVAQAAASDDHLTYTLGDYLANNLAGAVWVDTDEPPEGGDGP